MAKAAVQTQKPGLSPHPFTSLLCLVQLLFQERDATGGKGKMSNAILLPSLHVRKQ